jgi:hypothetical protein
VRVASLLHPVLDIAQKTLDLYLKFRFLDFQYLEPWFFQQIYRIAIDQHSYLIIVRSEDDPHGATSTNLNRPSKGGGRPPGFQRLIII